MVADLAKSLGFELTAVEEDMKENSADKAASRPTLVKGFGLGKMITGIFR